MVIKVTVIIAINCHQVSNNRPRMRGWCGRAAPRSREGERDNLIVWNTNFAFRQQQAEAVQEYAKEAAPPDRRCLLPQPRRTIGSAGVVRQISAPCAL